MLWNNIKRIDSAEGNVCKFVYSKSDAVAESVLYKYPTYEDRTVICCSTQSGCPVGCRFCGAGDYFVRSLKAEEIVSQVDHSISQSNTYSKDMKKLQIMFMSMGEPLLNYKELEKAIRELYRKYPNAALLISTIGPNVKYGPLFELSQEIPTVGLQFSLHKSTDEERNKLIPFKEKLSLREIATVGTNWNTATGRQPFFNYCAGDDNSSDEDADRILSLFNPAVWQCTISVICERSEELFPYTNNRQRELAVDFSEKMLKRGYSVRVFDPAGQDDISGGCGQLTQTQQWMKNNPDKARKSIGYGLPIIHAPTLCSP